MMERKPKISIITITYNAGETLERTIKSIECQSYPEIEYIIIDGKSTDNTIEIIKAYSEKIDYWESEPDKGLYDAMNKGIAAATGDYLWFINAGDEIFDNNTLSQVFGEEPFADIYYGNTVMTDMNGALIGNRRLEPPKTLTWKSFKKGMLVSHQSIIVRRDIAESYNLKYRFSADFEWCIQALKKASSVRNTNLTLSKFLDGGITKKNIIPGLKERFDIMKRYYGFLGTLLAHIPISIKFVLFFIRNKRF
jgi:glycosyltransferase involved in cell wall biosynthesis